MTQYMSYNVMRKKYLEEKEEKELTREYIRRIDLTLKRIFKWLKEDHRTTCPTRITYDDLLYIRDKVPISSKSNRSSRNQKNVIEIFRYFLKWCGNYVKQPPFRPYHPNRPRTTARDYDTIMLELEGTNDWDLITTRIMVLLGSLGIRRIGQLRLRPEDIQEDRINVIGKGRHGGKPRVLPINGWIYATLKEYMDLRREIIMDCLAKLPGQAIPEKLLIYYTYQNIVGSIQKTKFDRLFRELSERVGVKVTAHTLRRYGATEVYRATKNPEVTMNFGGWEDAKTMRDYIGIYPDLADAIDKVILMRLNRVKIEYPLTK